MIELGLLFGLGFICAILMVTLLPILARIIVLMVEYARLFWIGLTKWD